MNIDIDATLRDLQSKLGSAIHKFNGETESSFEWLKGVVSEARTALGVCEIKVPKTPAKKRARNLRQTRKNSLASISESGPSTGNLDDSHPTKKSRQHDGLDLSVLEDAGEARPKRKASSAAQSKIKQAYKYFSATTLHRPSIEGDLSMVNAVDVYYSPSSANASKVKTEKAQESRLNSPVARITRGQKTKKNTLDSFEIKEASVQDILANDKPVSSEQSRPKRERKPRKLDFPPGSSSSSAAASDSITLEIKAAAKLSKSSEQPIKDPAEVLTETADGTDYVPVAKKTRGKKQNPEENEKLNQENVTANKPLRLQSPVAQPPADTQGNITEEPSDNCTEDVSIVDANSCTVAVTVEEPIPQAKKTRGRKPKAPPREEVVPAASERVTRSKKTVGKKVKSIDSGIDITEAKGAKKKSPCVTGSPCKRNFKNLLTSESPKSPILRALSPLRKKFAAAPLFSPFKKTPLKNKVEAFEAKLRGETVMISEEEEAEEGRSPQVANSTFVKSSEAAADLSSEADKENSQERRSSRSRAEKQTLQTLSRKSVTNAKRISQAAALKKLLTAPVGEGASAASMETEPRETAEEFHTPNGNAKTIVQPLTSNASGQTPVKLTRATNATLQKCISSPSILNKTRLMTASSSTCLSGSSGSSTENSQSRFHPLLLSKAVSANMLPSLTTFVTKNVIVGQAKPNEEDETQRKELELRRLKEKEEEAARKREEMLKAKAEEKKLKMEERAKRARERRLARAQELEEQNKARLITEEKAAAKQKELKAKLLEENEKRRIAFTMKLLEAEERRKAEELKQQQLREQEEQKKLAAKKEHEEQEKLAKIKQAETEKAAKAKPQAKADQAAAGSANSTFTLLPKAVSEIKHPDNYQITPVRVKKTGVLAANPDNYDIGDLASDDSTDDDGAPKKHIPTWARSAELKTALKAQCTSQLRPEEIFPVGLLAPPDLNIIFHQKKARFNKRTSSAIWNTPPAKLPFF